MPLDVSRLQVPGKACFPPSNVRCYPDLLAGLIGAPRGYQVTPARMGCQGEEGFILNFFFQVCDY